MSETFIEMTYTPQNRCHYELNDDLHDLDHGYDDSVSIYVASAVRDLATGPQPSVAHATTQQVHPHSGTSAGFHPAYHPSYDYFPYGDAGSSTANHQVDVYPDHSSAPNTFTGLSDDLAWFNDFEGFALPEMQARGHDNASHFAPEQSWENVDTMSFLDPAVGFDAPSFFDGQPIITTLSMVQPIMSALPLVQPPQALGLPQVGEAARVEFGTANNGHLFCPEGCPGTFGRPSEYRRHMKKHAPHDFRCPVIDCHRTFYRADKMLEHFNKGHKIN
ncbi:hypothetical protein T440DRAFT_541034 [Plenodomus tracheiphilus IPT5]|uniref:C2H2-type domain-containing protein n=1 Tax=Plenodomus tracheiphilus IPT5 TaxID=1408161 RepID=A0A6A7AW93_9PLEO|nr:hypothetical protein T440DRAFT_541034 [Plenodomus tracheiphilus IPT5]